MQPNKLTEISQNIILTIKEWQRKRMGKPHRKTQKHYSSNRQRTQRLNRGRGSSCRGRALFVGGNMKSPSIWTAVAVSNTAVAPINLITGENFQEVIRGRGIPYRGRGVCCVNFSTEQQPRSRHTCRGRAYRFSEHNCNTPRRLQNPPKTRKA